MFDLVLGLHLMSHHFQEHDYQRNVNPGIYIRAENGLTLGTYRNTLGRTSVYAGVTFGDQVALTVGAVTGYQRKQVDLQVCDDGAVPTANRPCYRGFSKGWLTPMIAPSVRLGAARLSYIPAVGNASSVLHLSIERKF